MKKLIILAGAALLALVACNKSETVNTTAQKEITLKAVAGSVTKGAELSGDHLFSNYSIYAAATQKSAAGVIENASFWADPFEKEFVHGIDPEPDPASAVPAATLWKVKTTSEYWPFGGAILDFLAYAMPRTAHTSGAGKWVATWTNNASDVASEVTFSAVDTYANQADVLYAVANGKTSATSGASDYVAMKFAHAQALLLFNLQIDADAKAADFKIKSIQFVDETRLAQLSAGSAAALTVAQVTLKTVGTFTVDNSHVALKAAWEDDLAANVANYAVKATPATVSSANVGPAAVVNFNATPAAAGTNYQIGDGLLIPQQDKVNFLIEYEVGGNTMYYLNNDIRGVWEMGKKYIYNLNVDLQEIIITETVKDFVSAPTNVPLS